MTNMYEDAFNIVPVGMFIIDLEHRVHAWNNWMAEHTKISSQQATGKTLEELFPAFQNARFCWALDQVITHSAEQVMSYALNRYLIPIPVNYAGEEEVKFMPQQVYLSSVQLEDGTRAATILLLDMTENVIRSNTLLQVAFKLEEDSHRDTLTNAYNRRFLTEWLIQQAKLIERYHYSVSCLLFDLDHFKKINDEYGHDKGDEVLVSFVKYVETTLRDSDILVRYGGEEFLVLLSHTELEMARQAAERIRERIENLSVAGLPAGKLTTSIGVSCWDSEHHSDYSHLLKMADDALYQAKNQGRNRVCVASEVS
ncbi:MAG: diguanylate cyclase [Coxiellaceae bacterium]|nr:diguanylate cyclase [Coxiellaceae bacterium]